MALLSSRHGFEAATVIHLSIASKRVVIEGDDAEVFGEALECETCLQDSSVQSKSHYQRRLVRLSESEVPRTELLSIELESGPMPLYCTLWHASKTHHGKLNFFNLRLELYPLYLLQIHC